MTLNLDSQSLNVVGALTAASFGGITSANLVDKNAAETIGAAWQFGGNLSHTFVTASSTSLRTKYRVWNSTVYGVGMGSAYTFGGLGDFAMTFQMNSQAARGFWWGDDIHTNAQGAMSLTTNGKLAVAHSLRLGYGESDTTIPGATYALDVSGQMQVINSTLLYLAGDAGQVTELKVGAYATTNGGKLYLRGTTANKEAILQCTNGNLHIDANPGNSLYLNYFDGVTIFFGGGASNTNANVSAAGKFTMKGLETSVAPTKSALGIPYYVTSGYVGGKISVQSTAPGSPTKGDLWFDDS